MRVGFPVPDFQAETCARDLAADVRSMILKAIPINEALQRGELTEDERNELILLNNNIAGMCDTIIMCAETGKHYRVGDYVTARTELQAVRRDALWKRAYEKLKRVLH